MRQRDELSAIGAAGYRLNRRRLLRAAAASGMAALGLIPSTIRPGRFVRADTTINVLAPQWPQGPKEQALAEEWSKQSGIAVTFDAVNYANLEQRVKLLVDGESTDYDIYDYDSQWIGGFVQAGALERLDTPDYLGASGVAIRMGDFFPEITSRLCQYPAAEPNAQSSAPSPVYGLPWSLNCEVLWYRTDLMDAPPASWDDLRTTGQSADHERRLRLRNRRRPRCRLDHLRVRADRLVERRATLGSGHLHGRWQPQQRTKCRIAQVPGRHGQRSTSRSIRPARTGRSRSVSALF